jgi:hypothetical protein
MTETEDNATSKLMDRRTTILSHIFKSQLPECCYRKDRPFGFEELASIRSMIANVANMFRLLELPILMDADRTKIAQITEENENVKYEFPNKITRQEQQFRELHLVSCEIPISDLQRHNQNLMWLEICPDKQPRVSVRYYNSCDDSDSYLERVFKKIEAILGNSPHECTLEILWSNYRTTYDEFFKEPE